MKVFMKVPSRSYSYYQEEDAYDGMVVYLNWDEWDLLRNVKRQRKFKRWDQVFKYVKDIIKENERQGFICPFCRIPRPYEAFKTDGPACKKCAPKLKALDAKYANAEPTVDQIAKWAQQIISVEEWEARVEEVWGPIEKAQEGENSPS